MTQNPRQRRKGKVFGLRDLAASDLEALTALDRICFERGIAFTRAQIAGFLELESVEGVAAEAQGRIVGFAIGYLRRPGLAGVLTIDVHPDCRRSGVGRALFRELLARFEQAGASRVRLEVDVRNADAIAFYRSFGFRRIGRLADYYGGGRDAYEMERASGPAGRGRRAGSTRSGFRK